MNFDHIPHPEDLVHYGVKGMRWGVRRKAKRDSRATYNASDRLPKHRNKVAARVAKRKALSPKYAKKFDAYQKTEERRQAQRAIGTAGATVGAYWMLSTPSGNRAMRKGANVAAKGGMKVMGKAWRGYRRATRPKNGQDGYQYVGDFIDATVRNGPSIAQLALPRG